jgi:hypothetical protein
MNQIICRVSKNKQIATPQTENTDTAPPHDTQQMSNDEMKTCLTTQLSQNMQIKQSMINDSRNALVVEGGGMRGAFTCGVLDAFLQQNFNPF